MKKARSVKKKKSQKAKPKMTDLIRKSVFKYFYSITLQNLR